MTDSAAVDRQRKERVVVRDILQLLWLAVLIAAFTGCATGTAFASNDAPAAPRMDRPHVLLNSGHTASVNQMVRDERTGYVFTASNDGTVRIWDDQSGDLQQVIRISHLPVVSIAVNPASPELAAIVSDGGVFIQLSVWDWNTGTRLFTRPLPEVPLFVQYSPQGTFLLYGRTQWNSLTFLAARSGTELPYLPNGFGIVRYAMVSASERTIMTYSPTNGNLIYWDLQSGAQKATVPAVPNLNQVTAINDAYVAASVGSTFAVLNLVSGSIASERDLGNVQAISVDKGRQEVAVLYSLVTAKPGTSQIALYSVRDGQLSEIYLANSEISGTVTSFLLRNGGILVGRAGGKIDSYARYGSGPDSFGPNVVVPITDIAFSDDRFFAATSSGLLSIRSDFFAAPKPLSQISMLSENEIDNPFDAPSGLLALSNHRLFLYRTGDADGELLSVDPASLTLGDTYSQFESPILELTDAGPDILSLERNGRIRLLNSYSFNTDFSFTSAGTLSAAFTGSYGLIIGKNNSNILDSSLTRVNPSTGETVSIGSDSFIVFALAFDAQHDSLFSLGLQHQNGSEATVLTRYTGTDFSQRETIAGYAGEDIQASVSFDGGRVFTTLGYDRVQVWDGSNMSLLRATGHIPRKVISRNGRVFGVNRDGSVSVWDETSRDHLFDFYALPDGSWVILTPDGNFLPSSTGNPTHYLTLITSNRTSTFGRQPRSLSDFRLRLKGDTGPQGEGF
ncbi:MAG TPA: WD40 repeat domain-containing protein [Spirochaetia bacterium]|nr:WD40 repeat domain-containing protein [Spirochaetia bacterium]